MYIREILIDGFLSYRAETRVSGLSPAVNVVIGRNGSGKSNFFAAIRFVFSDLPVRRTRDLVFRGRSSKQAGGAARVEVVLADAGSRFFGLGNEVRIAREISGDDDKFTVNGQLKQKVEMRAMLEAAGLSSGGVFIVPQGEITKLATATDVQRLEMLLNTSGAQAFEDRKQASLATLDEAQGNIEEIDEHLARIARRLEIVQREVEDLNEFLDLKKEIRGVEYILLNIEKQRAASALGDESGNQESQREALDSAIEALEERVSELSQAKAEAANADAAFAEREAERDEAAKIHTQRRAALRAEQAAAVDAPRTVSTLAFDESIAIDNELDYMEDDEAVLSQPVEESDVEDAEAELERVRRALAAETRELAAVSTRLRALQLKDGRAHQLKPEERRARQLEAQKRQEAVLKECQAERDECLKRISQLEQDLKAAEVAQASFQAELADVDMKVEDAGADERDARAQLADAESERSLAQLSLRKAAISHERQTKTAEELARVLASGSKSSSVAGIGGVRELASKLDLGPSKYFGTVADLLDIDPVVAQAADVVGGSQLFYHVVDNTDTARKLLDGIVAAQGRAGGATFVPLADVLVDPTPEFPSVQGTTPLTDYVRVRDARFDIIPRFLFGRFVLCESLQKAASYAKQYQLPTVTVEGDRCDPYGAVSGGASDPGVVGGNNRRSSRHQAVRDLGAAYDSLIAQDREIAELRKSVERAAQLVTQRMDRLSRSSAQRRQATLEKDDAKAQAQESMNAVNLLMKQLDDARRYSSDLEADVVTAQQELEAATTESAYAGELSKEERIEITELGDREKQLTVSVDALAKREYDATTALATLRRRRAVQARRIEAQNQIDAAADVARAERNVELAAQELGRLRMAAEEAAQRANEMHDAVRAAEEEVAAADAEVKLQHRRLDSRGVKRRALSQFVSEIDTKLRALVNVPESALERAGGIVDLRDRELRSLTRELNERHRQLDSELTRFDTVNKKAADQYDTYSAELAALRERRARLDAEQGEVKDTIRQLDSLKQTRLNAALSKISSKFSQTFAALSGGHEGSLNLRYTGETITSIGLDVSFGESTAQLSGGQKTICALALIFAVQESEPAPFYILDEIDANLDAAARRRVAKLIRRVADNTGAQFILTTFRSEFVDVADSWFGVSYTRESKIESVDKQLASEFMIADV